MNAIGKEGTITVESLLSLSNEELEKLGDAIHEAWMARTEKEEYNAKLFVPYSELPRDEQEKDLSHVRVTLETISEVLEGNLTIEALRSKYKDMDRYQQH